MRTVILWGIVAFIFAAGFSIGLAYGSGKKEIIYKEKTIDGLDLSNPNLEQNVEVCANYLGKMLTTSKVQKKDLIKYFQQEKEELDRLKADLEKNKHNIWYRGYIEGLKKGTEIDSVDIQKF